MVNKNSCLLVLIALTCILSYFAVSSVNAVEVNSVGEFSENGLDKTLFKRSPFELMFTPDQPSSALLTEALLSETFSTKAKRQDDGDNTRQKGRNMPSAREHKKQKGRKSSSKKQTLIQQGRQMKPKQQQKQKGRKVEPKKKQQQKGRKVEPKKKQQQKGRKVEPKKKQQQKGRKVDPKKKQQHQRRRRSSNHRRKFSKGRYSSESSSEESSYKSKRRGHQTQQGRTLFFHGPVKVYKSQTDRDNFVMDTASAFGNGFTAPV